MLILFVGLIVLLWLDFGIAKTSSIIDMLAILLWPVWILSLIVYTVGSPDLRITDQGLNLKILWEHYMIEWAEIISVRSDALQSWIFVRQLTPFNYLIGMGVFSLHPAIQVGRWRKNYREALRYIESQIDSQRS